MPLLTSVWKRLNKDHPTVKAVSTNYLCCIFKQSLFSKPTVFITLFGLVLNYKPTGWASNFLPPVFKVVFFYSCSIFIFSYLLLISCITVGVWSWTAGMEKEKMRSLLSPTVRPCVRTSCSKTWSTLYETPPSSLPTTRSSYRLRTIAVRVSSTSWRSIVMRFLVIFWWRSRCPIIRWDFYPSIQPW